MHAVTETGPWIELNEQSDSAVSSVQALAEIVVITLKNGTEITQKVRDPLVVARRLVASVERRHADAAECDDEDDDD